MQKIVFSILFSISFYGGFSQTIPKLTMDDVLKMADTSSVPLVINFWATWCHPCIDELPWFEKNVAAYQHKHVKLLLVSLDIKDDYPDNIAKFAKAHGYTSPIVWLNETDVNAFCPKLDAAWKGTIPVTLMINNHKHYKQFFNQQLPEPRLKLELEKLLE
jgi:thiol-disulfide isomerase/thioredoxin